MDKNKIIGILEGNDLSDIEEIEYKDGIFVLRFFYDFDKAELDAAKAFANDESDEEEASEVWTEEYFIPYLMDLAIDNVGESIEEVMEESNISAQYMSYDLTGEDTESCEFIAVFYSEEIEIEIETVLDELKL